MDKKLADIFWCNLTRDGGEPKTKDEKGEDAGRAADFIFPWKYIFKTFHMSSQLRGLAKSNL